MNDFYVASGRWMKSRRCSSKTLSSDVIDNPEAAGAKQRHDWLFVCALRSASSRHCVRYLFEQPLRFPVRIRTTCELAPNFTPARYLA